MNEWHVAEKVADYRSRADTIPHRAEGEAVLEPGGLFCNLEHVASGSEALHQEFLDALGIPEDASNKLLDVETQLRWLRELGFADVDCLWRWRELALLFGRR